MAASPVVKMWPENSIVRHRSRCVELSNDRRRRRSISSFGKIGEASKKALPRAIAVLRGKRARRCLCVVPKSRRYVFLLDLGLKHSPHLINCD